MSMEPGEHPGSPPDCTKCGATGEDVHWDSEMCLWRGSCSKPFCAAVSGRVRKSPHQVFTFLDGRILIFLLLSSKRTYRWPDWFLLVF